MSTEDPSGRRLWIGIAGPVLDESARRLLDEIRPGGIVLFARNFEDRPGLELLCRELRSLLGPRLHVAVDQEGGLVARFGREFMPWPGSMTLGAASVREPSIGEHLAGQFGYHAACELGSVGVEDRKSVV